jgi:DNA modification methylase
LLGRDRFHDLPGNESHVSPLLDCATEAPLLGEVHPTAKPVPLLRYLIDQLTDPGDTVFDPFMGIGSTGLACQQSGREFIGIEIDPAYYELAMLRLPTHAAS